MIKLTLEQAEKKILEAISSAKRRKEIEHFDDEKNIYELLFAIDYALNPPEKTGRKGD